MIWCPIPRHTRILGEKQPEFEPLHVRDVFNPNYQCMEMLAMIRPTAEEVQALQNGQPLIMSQLGMRWVPAALYVSHSLDGDE